MSDGQRHTTVERRPLVIRGLGITYQITIGDGRTLAFEVAEDATIDRRDLDELLDRLGGAAERRQAIFELPLVKAGLAGNRAQLRLQQRARAQAEAVTSAKTLRTGRRNEQPIDVGSVQAAVAQYDERIRNLVTAIATAEARVPYLEAIIRRDENVPEMFPQIANDQAEAAE